MSANFTDNLHIDDLLFFQQVERSMRRVAKDYELRLREVRPIANAKDTPIYGDCSPHEGVCRIAFRVREADGTWAEFPLPPKEVWDTAAHELAHLRYSGHGESFKTFHAELLVAIQNTQETHREKLISKLVKMQKRRASEAEIGNAEAADAFARMINKLLIEHEINASELDYAREGEKPEAVIELRVDLAKFGMEKKKARQAWMETLASVIASAHLCKILVRPGSNVIWFVGTESHAAVAEYAFGVLAPAAMKMSEQARRDFRNECRRKPEYKAIGKKDGFPEAYGYRESWLDAFVRRIAERMEETRQQAVAEAPDSSTALVRLNGALVRVNQYIDAKFGGKKRSASYLGGSRKTSNSAGRAAGKAAADRMNLGQRALKTSAPRAALKA